MKKMIFTHNDMDGIACIIVAKRLNPDDEIDYRICSYGNINSTIANFIKNKGYKEYDEIFITDISVNAEVAALVEINPKLKSKLILLDHHESAKWLNSYEWANVIPMVENELSCGASLLYSHFKDKGAFDRFNSTYDLIYHVRLWDTWDWSRKKHLLTSENAVKLNSLFHLLGESRFIYSISKNDFVDVNSFLERYKLLLDITERQKNEYINSKESQLRSIMVSNYNVGVVFADNHLSELGNVLAEKHPEFDFIAMISGTTVSFRSREDSKINLGAVVNEFYGGGGHPHAAGCTISKEITEEAMCLFLG